MRVSVIWGLIGLGFCLLLAAALHPWSIDSHRAAAGLDSAWAQAGGLRWRAPRSATLTLAPWPTLDIEDLDVGDDGDQIHVTARAARIRLRLPDLILGRLRAASADLLGGGTHIDLDAATASEIDFEAANFPFGVVKMSGGALRLTSASRGLDESLETFEGRLDWRSAGGPVKFDFAALWRGETVTARGQLDSPPRFRKGETSVASLSLGSRFGEFATAGGLSKRGPGEFKGDLTASVSSLSGLQAWLGLPNTIRVPADTIALRAKAAATSRALDLSDAHLDLGAQPLEGSLGFTWGEGKLAASGTFATEALDLGAVLGAPPRFRDPEGQWSTAPLLPPIDANLGLDLRVSGSRVVWGAWKLENAAVALRQGGGKLTAKLLEAGAYGGALTGEATVETGGSVCGWRFEAALENADMGALARDWGLKSYSGVGGFQAKIDASGDSAAAIIASAKGSATIDQANVVILDVSFEEALRRAQRRPLDVARDMLAGQSKFAQAYARLAIGDGEARIVSGHARGSGAALTIEGAIGLTARDWRTRFIAMQADASGEPAPDGARLAVDLVGPWSAPNLVPVAKGE